MNNKGNSAIIIVIIVAVLAIVAASAASYYVLKSQGVDVSVDQIDYFKPAGSQTDQSSDTDISEDDDVSTLEDELNSTTVDSTDADLQDLNSQTTGL